MGREHLHILRLKQQAADTVVNELRHAADAGGNGGAVHPRAFGERIGEGLRERGQHVDIDGIVKAVGIGNPAGKTDRAGGTQLLCKRLQLGHLLAVACDDQTAVWMCLYSPGQRHGSRYRCP